MKVASMSKHPWLLLTLGIFLALRLPISGYPMAAEASPANTLDPGRIPSGTPNTQAALGFNIVANGSFETPDVTSSTFDTYYPGQSFGGWTVDSGSVDFISEHYWQAADGRQSVDLSGYEAGAISQVLPTSPSQGYLLQFAMAGNPESSPCSSPGPIRRMEVWWGTTLLDTLEFDTTGHSNWSMGWGYHQYRITATTAATRLVFKSLTPSCYGPVIDKVSVQSYSGDVPLLDLPLNYTGKRFSDVALGHNVGGWVNSWFDHDTPDYKKNQKLQLWNGAVLTSSAMIDVSNCAPPPGAFGLSCYDGHNGLDFQRQYTDTDTIYAAAPGIVVDLCDHYPCAHPAGVLTSDPSYGKWVLMQHGDPGNYGKYATFYAHLSAINPNLHIGTEITDTQAVTLGIMGGTGGWQPHLHFGVYYDANGNNKWEETYQGYTEAVDPYGWSGSTADPWWNTSTYLWKSPLWDRETGDQQGALLTTPSGRGKVTILPGVITSPITLELWDTPLPTTLPAGGKAAGHAIWLRVLEWLGGASSGPAANPADAAPGFSQPVSVNIRYSADEMRHLNTSQLSIYRQADTTHVWEALPTTVNASLLEATAPTTLTGAFMLRAPLLCPSDSQEPNDTSNTATPLSVGEVTNNGFDVQRDEDWFWFVAEENGNYAFTTSNLSTGVNTKIEVYDQDGRTLLGTGTGSKASQLKWRAPSSGTYFARVYQPSSITYGCGVGYRLSLTQERRVYLPLVQ